jgi:hypothetical protein
MPPVGRRAGRNRSTTAALLVGVLAVTGCVGAQSRDEFEQLIRRRGGGASNLGVDEVLDTLQSRVGGDALIRQATFGFGVTYGSFEVQTRARPIEVDQYTIYGTDVRRHEPVRNPDEAATVPASRLAALDVEAIVDRALAEFAVSDGSVTNLIVTPGSDRIQVSVESARASGYAVFTLDGDFVEFVRA